MFIPFGPHVLHLDASGWSVDLKPARYTFKRLGLNHALMKQFRKAAIEAMLEMRGRGHASLDLRRARVRLNVLRAAEHNHGRLEPFCFVLKQALQRHISCVEAIRKSKRALR
jgi:hypothetical protein